MPFGLARFGVVTWMIGLELRSARVTQSRRLSGRKHGGHELALAAQLGTPDGIDPSIETVKPTLGKPALDACPAQPKVEQLPQRDDSVLPRSEFGHAWRGEASWVHMSDLE